MKVLVSYVCFDRQYFNTVDSLYLDYPLSQTNFLVTCEFEIERIHYKYLSQHTLFIILWALFFTSKLCGKKAQPYNPIQDGSFWGCSRMDEGGGGQKNLPSLKCLTYPTIMELATVIPYLKKDLINHLTHPLSYADTSIFSSKIRKFCYFKKHS